jgi:hypothetical protein
MPRHPDPLCPQNPSLLSPTPDRLDGSPDACAFVPPYLLRHIADAEEEHLLRSQQRTLRVDDRFRSRRESAGRRRLVLDRPGPAAASDQRVIYDAENTEELPGRPARREGEVATGDVAVDEAYESAGQVWNLFAHEFGRRSVDGRGSTLPVTVHFGRNYDNAFWDGTQLVFGDGDGEIFERFTKPMDVMAHEFTHGVTQYTAGLIYQGQSGALNESVGDVFAAMTRQRMLGHSADQADWLIGAGLFRPGVQARALRSMLEPGTAYDDPRLGRDPQVGSMADYVETEEDNGGVHVNSGIPNRAFALAALGIGGRSWEHAGPVWYDALTGGQVGPRTDFRGFAAATLNAAETRFGADPRVAAAVREAWRAVGVLDADGSGGPADPGWQAVLPELIEVRRTGGFAGLVRSAALDLTVDPAGPEVRRLLTQVSPDQFSLSRPQPDRFVYTVQYGDWNLTVPEQDLTPELHRVVQLVLDPSGLGLS